MLRKDIENMQWIMLTIKKLERTGDTSRDIAERLDTLYSALKLQASEVYQNQLMIEEEKIQ